jgi:hypothetical protein
MPFERLRRATSHTTVMLHPSAVCTRNEAVQPSQSEVASAASDTAMETTMPGLETAGGIAVQTSSSAAGSSSAGAAVAVPPSSEYSSLSVPIPVRTVAVPAAALSPISPAFENWGSAIQLYNNHISKPAGRIRHALSEIELELSHPSFLPQLSAGPKTQLPGRYELEGLIGKRTVNGRAEYLVKWSGYPESESTWEAAKQLKQDGCQASITEYERRQLEPKTDGPATKQKTETRWSIPAVTTESEEENAVAAAARASFLSSAAAVKIPAVGSEQSTSEQLNPSLCSALLSRYIALMGSRSGFSASRGDAIRALTDVASEYVRGIGTKLNQISEFKQRQQLLEKQIKSSTSRKKGRKRPLPSTTAELFQSPEVLKLHATECSSLARYEFRLNHVTADLHDFQRRIQEAREEIERRREEAEAAAAAEGARIAIEKEEEERKRKAEEEEETTRAAAAAANSASATDPMDTTLTSVLPLPSIGSPSIALESSLLLSSPQAIPSLANTVDLDLPPLPL